jgi:4-azaleucine resistance transporter AzlC
VRRRIISQYNFRDGLRDGVPIGLGYLSVSFGFGIAAVRLGIPALTSIIISLSNMTSAGQMAGITVIAASGTLIEMALAQLTINLRYSLMSISLSQKLDDCFSPLHRALTGFGMTDEIFAVASSKPGTVGPRYMYGLISLPYFCWTAGTALGALAGNILPMSVKDALGIAIYGMFVAIVVPPAKKKKGIAAAALLAAAVSCCLYFIPLFSFISGGFSIIICGTLAAGAAALLFPVPDESERCAEEVALHE